MDVKPHSIVFCGAARAEYRAAGLAIADELSKLVPSARMIFAAADRYVPTAIAAADYERFAVEMPSRPHGAMRSLALRWSGYHAARAWLRRVDPAAVVALGGNDGLALARSAVRLGVPLVVLEADVAPSTLTRSLARWASLVCLGFAETRQRLNAACPARVTGVPVSAALHRARWIRHRAPGQAKRLLVLADGEGLMDATLPAALAAVREHLAGWKIVHHTTRRRQVVSRYQEAGLPAMVSPAAIDVAGFVITSDLVVSHAGGVALAAVAAAGAPALVIGDAPGGVTPATQNAVTYGSAGACVPLLHEDSGQLLPRLTSVLPRLLANPDRRRRLSQAAPRLARPDAAWRVAVTVRDLLVRDRRQAA